MGRLRLPIRGRRVQLVRPTRSHLREVAELLNEPTVGRWTLHIPYPYRYRDAVEWFHRSSRNRRLGRSLSMLIVGAANGRVLGGIGFVRFAPETSSAEIGYWVGRPYRGQGYASEALRLALRAGFRDLKLHRIQALIFPKNLASRRLAMRCGLRFEGRIRDEVQKNGVWRDSLLYAVLATDRIGRPRRSR